MFAEISVTGLTSHSFAILPSKNSQNFETKLQFCSFSYLQFSSYSFHLTISFHLVSQNASVHGLPRVNTNEPPRPTHFLCEGCRNRWIEVKDRDNERRGVAQARLEVACPLCWKDCVLRNGPSGSVRIDPFFGFRMRWKQRLHQTQLFYLIHFYRHHVNILFMLPFNKMINDLY